VEKMMNKRDQQTVNITPKSEPLDLHKYKVIYHFVDGSILESHSGEVEYTPNEFMNAMCYDRFVRLPDEPIVINMNLVTYLEIKEIKNEE
jgi:hypothetical protein